MKLKFSETIYKGTKPHTIQFKTKILKFAKENTDKYDKIWNTIYYIS